MKKTNKLSVILLSTLSICSINAIASPYVSGQFGVYGTSDSNNAYDNLFHNKSRITGRIAAGYLWGINPCTELGLESGVQGYQKIREQYTVTDATLRRYSIDALGVVDYRPIQYFNVFAKAGAAYVREKINVHTTHYDYSSAKGTVVPKAVIGAGYDVLENVNVNLSVSQEFKRHGHFVATLPMPAATSAMAGVNYRF